jgi:hypothetical protein
MQIVKIPEELRRGRNWFGAAQLWKRNLAAERTDVSSPFNCQRKQTPLKPANKTVVSLFRGVKFDDDSLLMEREKNDSRLLADGAFFHHSLSAEILTEGGKICSSYTSLSISFPK